MARWSRFAAVLGALTLLTAMPPGSAAGACQFVLGFGAFADHLPLVMGQCLDDEQHDLASGDALQHTTTGLLVWRKADNFTAFTAVDGTWIKASAFKQQLHVAQAVTIGRRWRGGAGREQPKPAAPRRGRACCPTPPGTGR